MAVSSVIQSTTDHQRDDFSPENNNDDDPILSENGRMSRGIL